MPRYNVFRTLVLILHYKNILQYVETEQVVVTFIKQDIGYRIVEINQEQEVLVVEGSESVKIANLYNPETKYRRFGKNR